MTGTNQSVSRRTVVAGTAWAVPAVVVATAAPAVAASPTSCLALTLGANSCRQTDADGNTLGFLLQICVTNVCNVPANVNVSAVQGSSVDSRLQQTSVDIRVGPNAGPVCARAPIIYCDAINVAAIKVTFAANRGPVQTQSVTLPPNCGGDNAVC